MVTGIHALIAETVAMDGELDFDESFSLISPCPPLWSHARESERKDDYPDREAKMMILKKSDSLCLLRGEGREPSPGGRGKVPSGKLSVRGFEHGRAPSLLKGKSHECLQVTEEYRPNWKGGGCVGVGSLESLVTLGARW
ncbi:hypothetical protein CEXT_568551 [Caerostris extrusa]|uniref:Uncharacterized protein n=1 Tax=Caerostris extrusa TaxID=172846 RepID=A0AAV4YBT0_CAEEX|nr:hypothetical protein CEXT_568551 [Caerostris extrusa]